MKKKTQGSIAEHLKEDVLVQEASLDALQEDLRQANKERLQSSAKRQQLLDSLRESFAKSQQAASPIPTRESVIAALRAGERDELDSCLRQLQRDLNTLRSKGAVSSASETKTREFINQAGLYLKKQTLVDKLGQKIPGGETPVTGNQVKLLNMYQGLSEELREQIEQLIQDYEALDQEIQHNLEKEEQAKTQFYSALSVLAADARKTALSRCHAKCRDARIDKRIWIYKRFVEQLVKASPAAASKVHALTRKNARQYAAQGLYTKAVHELCEVLSLWREEPESYRLLANLFEKMGDVEKETVALREYLRQAPSSCPMRKRLAALYLKQENLDMAALQYETLLNQEPGNFALMRELGQLKIQLRHYGRAAEILETYLKQYPEDVEARKTAGIANLWSRHPDAAFNHLRHAYEKQPKDGELIQYLAITYRNLSMYDSAIQVIERGLNEIGASMALLLLLGGIYQDCEEWAKAEDAFRALTEEYRPAASVLLALAQSQSQQGKHDAAWTTLQQAHQLDPAHYGVLVELGKQRHRRQEYEEAQSLYLKAAEQNPNHAEIWQQLGMLCTETGDWQKAGEYMRKSQELLQKH